MSKPLMICLIALTVNLVGMLSIYSFMAYALTRLRWGRGGTIAVFITIIAAQLFWIVPARLGLKLYFGNSLVTAFGIIIFCQIARRIPRQLEDSARLDGCGWLRIYWHVILPLVRRGLVLIALLTMMATVLPFWAALSSPDDVDPFLPLFESLPGWSRFSLRTTMVLVTFVMTLPVILVFFLARQYLGEQPIPQGNSTSPSRSGGL